MGYPLAIASLAHVRGVHLWPDLTVSPIPEAT